MATSWICNFSQIQSLFKNIWICE